MTATIKHECPKCGNTLFDQGFQTLYCGSCEEFHDRKEVAFYMLSEITGHSIELLKAISNLTDEQKSKLCEKLG